MRHILFGVLIAFCVSSTAGAQTVSKEFENALNDQGFEIVSTGYTWLWRIVVHATNGEHDREIVISRGSEQILQDNWRTAAASKKSSGNGLSEEVEPLKKAQPGGGRGGRRRNDGRGGNGGGGPPGK